MVRLPRNPPARTNRVRPRTTPNEARRSPAAYHAAKRCAFENQPRPPESEKTSRPFVSHPIGDRGDEKVHPTQRKEPTAKKSFSPV